jgi:hypothetical protein
MSKTLSFSKERVRVLVSSELDQVQGGFGPLSSALPPQTVSSVRPPIVATSSAHPQPQTLSSVRPAPHHNVSSVRPEPHHNVSSVRPPQTVSSALPSF